MDAGPRATILYVDDDDAGRYALSRFLRQEGFAVVEERDGAGALLRVHERPDLVLLDIQLPDMTGYDVCRRIKEDPATSTIPVLQVSAAFISGRDWATGLDQGADGYLVQPVDRVVLIATINQLLRVRRAEDALRRSEQRFRTLAEQLPALTYIADFVTPERLHYVSPQSATLIGVQADELLRDGSLWGAHMHRDDRDAVQAKLQAAAVACEPVEREYRMQMPDGREVWILDRAVIQYDDSGEPQYWQGIATDITERRAAEEAVRQLNVTLEERVAERTRELEAANRELEASSYSISRDMRAPLRAIDGFTRIVLEDHAESLSEEGRHLLSMVRDNARKIDEMVSGLLRFLQVGTDDLIPQVTDPARIARRAWERLLWQRDSSGEPPPRAVLRFGHVPRCVADPALLALAFGALLENAVKFSEPREEPTIEVGWQPDEEQPGTGAYFVRDNGVGFDMHYASKLFVMFERLHPRSAFPGTGVGLAIVQRIVARHGGRVWAEATVDGGATFYFTLPLAPPGAALAA